MNSQRLIEFLNENNVPYEENKPLAKFTTFRLGGSARIFINPSQTSQLALCQQYLLTYPETQWFLLGGGSNILIADGIFNGVVIHPDYPEEIEVLSETEIDITVKVPANARAPWVGRRLSEKGYSGVEFLTTIPGQFGGAVIQNAGCYGWELKDIIESVSVIENGQPRVMNNDECNFSYRDSIFKKETQLWIDSAVLKLPKGESVEIAKRIEDYKNRRLASQPRNRRSAGSIFKNPPPQTSSQKAWQLIDESGLRGTKKNGATISAEHCNFIVNEGHGNASDVYFLIRLIESTVLEKTGIKLNREVVLYGNFDEA